MSSPKPDNDRNVEEAMEKELISEQKRLEIAKKLQEKGVRTDCPMCGNKHWAVLDGYFNQTLQSNLKGVKFGGPSIPSAAIICTNCGFISTHALGALDLLDRDGSES